MTARRTVTLLAVAAMALVPAASEAGQILAQAASPLEIPGAPAAAPSGQAGQPVQPTPSPATPPSSTAPANPPAAAPPAQSPSPAAPGGSAAPQQPGADTGEDGADTGDVPPDEELSLGEIPTIETMELTPDIAKRALDSYIAAKEKYVNSDLEQYENLQDFVDQTEDGKKFEADIKAAGFANVTDWNLAITTLGLTYGAIVDDQTTDLEQQIKEVESDTELAQDIKDRMVKALRALIPSENNRKVVEDMMADAVYGEKLKLLDIEEE